VTVTANTRIVERSPRPLHTPTGLRPWFAQIATTGDASAGSVDLTIFVNPDSVSRVQYLSVHRWEFSANGTMGDCWLSMENSAGEWVEGYDASGTTRDRPIAGAIPTDVAGVSMAQPVQEDQPVYVGAITAGEQAAFVVRFQTNTDSVEYNTYLHGYVSDEPFVPGVLR
jgi:hypothetical protein